jgi:hypothetical protein
MDRCIPCPTVSSMLRAVAVATMMLVAIPASDAFAQTLTDTNPPAKWTPPQTAAKSSSAAHLKSCSAFGAGFVNVPGTDACVKIGGWVGVEGAVGR